ncbi:acyl carrier protein [Haloferula sp.]|uniref:acyl carrier protein n=1 Tax=Haloferula sp. TaxID=2497595 RepID=UPI003C7283E2
MAQGPELRQQIKEMMIEELMLDFEVSEIEDQTPIFGAGGLGLDSVDALQLVVAIEKTFGLKITDAEKAKDVLQSVETIAKAIEANGGAS